MNAWLAATCIVLGLGALFHSSTGVLNDKQKLGSLNSLSMLFHLNTFQGCSVEEYKNSGFALCFAEAVQKFPSFSSKNSSNINHAGLQMQFDQKSFGKEYKNFFPKELPYKTEDILYIVENFSVYQSQRFRMLLYYAICGADNVLQYHEFVNFVKFCLGGAELTEEFEANLRDIFDKLGMRVGCETCNLFQFAKGHDSIGKILNLCIGEKREENVLPKPHQEAK